MTNEMIERVAKAIHLKMGYKWPKDKDGCTICLNAARAAIQAMYEPTDQQRNFYYELKRESGSTPMYSTFEDATWEMMILACLLERRIG